MQPFKLFKKYGDLIFYLANLILQNTNTAETACCNVLLNLWRNRRILRESEFPVAIIAAVTTKMVSVKLLEETDASVFYDEGWSYLYGRRLPVNPKELDMLMFCLPGHELDILLLCGQGGISLSDAAVLVNRSEKQTSTCFLAAEQLLIELLTDDEAPCPPSALREEAQQVVCEMRTSLAEQFAPPAHSFSARFYVGVLSVLWDEGIAHLKTYIESIISFFCTPKVTAPSRSCQKMRIAAGLSLALFALLIVENISAPRDKLFAMNPASIYKLSQPIHNTTFDPLQASDTLTLDHLEYTLTALPPGFRRTEHFRSDSASHTYYKNDAGQIILFSQEIAPSKVTGINTKGLEEISFSGRTVALKSTQGLNELYWFYNRYCYSLITDLPRDTAIAVAAGASIKSQPFFTLQKLPLEAVPDDYTLYLSQENMDVVFVQGERPERLEALTEFVANCDAQIDGAVRVASFNEAGVTLYDFQMQDKRLYYTLDNHRNTQERSDVCALGEEFAQIAIVNTNGQNTITLYGDGKPTLEVFSYQ